MLAFFIDFGQRWALRSAAFAGIALMLFQGAPVWAGEPAALLFRDVPLPQSLSLCAERMPLENPSVREMLDRELTINAWEHAQVFMWIKRAGRAFPEIEKRLAKEGMPDDLKYLAVAESSLLTYAESNKAAVGTWQFIEETGMRYGLRKEALVDDRYCLESSTGAALRYLQKLRQEFGCWTLALAAYNCGEARLHREIEVQKVTDYYRLNLPLETERFVFRIAAIKLIMQNPQRYGYDIPNEHVYKPIKSDSISVQLEHPVHIADVAQGIGTDFKIIKELNPELTGYQLPNGSYTLKVPEGLGEKTLRALKSISAAATVKEKKH
jgi:membrane-bound lytic murein transglycosylase D